MSDNDLEILPVCKKAVRIVDSHQREIHVGSDDCKNCMFNEHSSVEELICNCKGLD